MTVYHLASLLHVQTNKMTKMVCFLAQLAKEYTGSRGHGFNFQTGLNVHIKLPVPQTHILN